MDALGIGALRQARSLPLSASEVRQFVATALKGSLAIAGALLLYRRAAGALLEPLSAIALIAVSLAAIATAWAAHLIAADQSTSFRTGWPARGDWVICLSLLIVAIALSIPGTSPVGLAVLWISFIGTGIGLWKLHRSPRIGWLIERGRLAGNSQPAPEDAEDATTQKLVYHRTVVGGTTVDGWLRIDLTPGQRTAIGHVAFCPAFAQSPTVEAELLDGPSGDIRTTLLLPWGVRWEVKLDEVVTEPQSLTLGFAATEGGR